MEVVPEGMSEVELEQMTEVVLGVDVEMTLQKIESELFKTCESPKIFKLEVGFWSLGVRKT